MLENYWYFTKILYFDSNVLSNSGTELHYTCVDTARAKMVLDYFIAQGDITINDFWRSVVNYALKSLNFFRYRLGIVMSGQKSISQSIATEVDTALTQVTGGLYKLSDLTLLDGSTCPASY